MNSYHKQLLRKVLKGLQKYKIYKKTKHNKVLRIKLFSDYKIKNIIFDQFKEIWKKYQQKQIVFKMARKYQQEVLQKKSFKCIRMNMMRSKIKQKLDDRAQEFRVRRHFNHYYLNAAFISFKILKGINEKIADDKERAQTFWKINVRAKLLASLTYQKDSRIHSNKLKELSSSYFLNKKQYEFLNKLKQNQESSLYYKPKISLSLELTQRKLWFKIYKKRIRMYSFHQIQVERTRNKIRAFRNTNLKNKTIFSLYKNNVDTKQMNKRVTELRKKCLIHHNLILKISTILAFKKYKMIKNQKKYKKVKADNCYKKFMIKNQFQRLKNVEKQYQYNFLFKQKNYSNLKISMLTFANLKSQQFRNIKSKFLFDTISTKINKKIKLKQQNVISKRFNQLYEREQKFKKIHNHTALSLKKWSMNMLTNLQDKLKKISTLKNKIYKNTYSILWSSLVELEEMNKQNKKNKLIADEHCLKKYKNKQFNAFKIQFNDKEKSHFNDKKCKKQIYYKLINKQFSNIHQNQSNSETYDSFKKIENSKILKQKKQGFKELIRNKKYSLKIKNFIKNKEMNKSTVLKKIIFKSLKKNYYWLNTESQVILRKNISEISKSNNLKRFLLKIQERSKNKISIKNLVSVIKDKSKFIQFNKFKKNIQSSKQNKAKIESKSEAISKQFKQKQNLRFISNLKSQKTYQQRQKQLNSISKEHQSNHLKTYSFESICSLLYYKQKDIINKYKSYNHISTKLCTLAFLSLKTYQKRNKFKKTKYAEARLERKQILIKNFIGNMIKFHSDWVQKEGEEVIDTGYGDQGHYVDQMSQTKSNQERVSRQASGIRTVEGSKVGIENDREKSSNEKNQQMIDNSCVKIHQSNGENKELKLNMGNRLDNVGIDGDGTRRTNDDAERCSVNLGTVRSSKVNRKTPKTIADL